MGISKIKPLTCQYHSVGGSRGRGLLCLAPQLVFAWFICFFVCFFVSNITRKQLDRFAWNFQGRCGVTMGRPDSILGQSGKRVTGSKVTLFVITGHSSQSHYHSLGGSRGLALTSQLHRWQQGAEFVVPRTTACSVFFCLYYLFYSYILLSQFLVVEDTRANRFVEFTSW